MKWAGIVFAPWLVACVVAAPAPRQPESTTSNAEPTAESATSTRLEPSAPRSAVPTEAEAASDGATAPPAPIAVEASFEPTRSPAPPRRPDAELTDMETRSLSFGADVPTVPCSVGGRDAQCVELADGPWLVSDYEALEGCPAALYLAAATKTDVPAGGKLELAWTVRVSDHGVHGARIAVAGNAKLFVAIESRRKSISPRCSITWSGYRSPKGMGTQPALMESPYR